MFVAPSVAIVLALLAPVSGQQAHQHEVSEKLGTVRFANSCAAVVQPTFARAMALLHSFEFGPAMQSFDATAAADPDCAIAYWGIAVSRWGNPFAPGAKPPKRSSWGVRRPRRRRPSARRPNGNAFHRCRGRAVLGRRHARSAHACPGIPRRDGTGRQAVQRRPGSLSLLRARARGVE